MATLDDITKLIASDLKGKIDALGAKATPRFGSSRLLVTLGIILGLVWFFHGQIGNVLGMIETLAIAFLVCRTASDVATIVMDGLIRKEIAKQLSQDGQLSEEDRAALDSVKENM
jgi:hypothetical protein